jgi:cis-3-alkyl-4-acyloxetan-2-one decarboxylase
VGSSSWDLGTIRHLYPWTPSRHDLGGGVEMSYLDEGRSDDGHAVLMLHGNPTWSFYYRNLVRALSPHTRCVVPDHVGSGLSGRPQRYDYTLRQHVDNVEALVDHLGLTDVTLVVHDWGGAIGLGWATRHPERVRRLVVLNTAAFRSEHIPASINLCRVPGLGELFIQSLNVFSRAALRWAVTRRMPRDVEQGYLLPYRTYEERIGQRYFVQDIPMNPRIPSWQELVRIEDRLALLGDKPLMICWGGADFCFDDRFLADWLERFPAAEVHRFADAGHYVLEDARHEVEMRLAAFLARTEPRLLLAGQRCAVGAV